MVTGAELAGIAKTAEPLLKRVKLFLDNKKAKDEQVRRTELAVELGQVIVRCILAGGSVDELLLANLVDQFENLVSNGAKPADLRHVRAFIARSEASTSRVAYGPAAYQSGSRGIGLKRPASPPTAKKGQSSLARDSAATRPASKKMVAKRPAANGPASKKMGVKRPAAKTATKASSAKTVVKTVTAKKSAAKKTSSHPKGQLIGG